MHRDEQLFWFQEGFHAGLLAQRGRLREAELARLQADINRDIQQLVGVLAVAMLEAGHEASSLAALRREHAKRGARER